MHSPGCASSGNSVPPDAVAYEPRCVPGGHAFVHTAWSRTWTGPPISSCAHLVTYSLAGPQPGRHVQIATRAGVNPTIAGCIVPGQLVGRAAWTNRPDAVGVGAQPPSARPGRTSLSFCQHSCSSARVVSMAERGGGHASVTGCMPPVSRRSTPYSAVGPRVSVAHATAPPITTAATRMPDASAHARACR
jgi:hypothetical protein